MDGTTHPFQVSTWLKEEPSLKFLGQARWIEVARCAHEWKAKEVAECLSIRHEFVQVAQFIDDRFVPYLWIPDDPETQTHKEATNGKER